MLGQRPLAAGFIRAVVEPSVAVIANEALVALA
jgi:hypothetical protein